MTTATDQLVRELTERFTAAFPTQLPPEGRRVASEFELLLSDDQLQPVNAITALWPRCMEAGLLSLGNEGMLNGDPKGFRLTDRVMMILDVGHAILEVITPPTASLSESSRDLQAAMRVLFPLLGQDLRLLGLAVFPDTTPDPKYWAPKIRGTIFRDCLGRQVHWNALTASRQVNVDVTRDEAIAAINFFSRLEWVLVALFGNTPMIRGKMEGSLAFRNEVWSHFLDERDRTRLALPRPMESFEDYVRFLLDQTVLLWKNSGGEMVCPRVRAVDLFEGMTGNELWDAFVLHEGTCWITSGRLRPSGYLEVRPICAQAEGSLAPEAFILGLLNNRDAAEEVLAQFDREDPSPDALTWRMRTAYTDGMSFPLAAQAVSQLLGIAWDSLPFPERRHLRIPYESLRYRMNPAQNMRGIDGIPGSVSGFEILSTLRPEKFGILDLVST